MRNLLLVTFARPPAAVFACRLLAVRAMATVFLALANLEEARAAGFFVTPVGVEAGQPFTFDVAMAGLDSPDGIFVEGTEQAVQIRFNVDRTSLTPGNCVAVRGFPGGVYTNWGRDWLITGPDANWSYLATGECHGTNCCGPGDYIASLDYQRVIGAGGLVGGGPPIDKKITVLNPVKVTVSSDNFITGGSVQIDIDIAGSGEAGTWSATVESISIVGPCSANLIFPDGATSWGVERTVTFPSPELLGNCGNIGRSGDYFIQLNYRHRFPSGGISNIKLLNASFKIRPILFNVYNLPATVSQQAYIAVYDLIAAGQYGEQITSVGVTCPDSFVDQILDDRLQTMNGALGPGNQGYVRLWPSPSFEGPCDLLENGTYTVTLTTLHQSFSYPFSFTNPQDETDTDGDGVTDFIDNCDEIDNPGQDDFDEDQMGDPCDSDDDNDGVLDSSDNCPMFISPHGEASPDQTDHDGDGMGDFCDPDDDNDSVVDSFPDNCRTTDNLDQSNIDGDILGDACDPDDDNDGLSDDAESAAGTDPKAVTPYNPGINPYSDGQPTGTSNPATTGEKVGVVISAPDGVDAVAVTVTDPNGTPAFEDTLIPHSPVVFSFIPNVSGTWMISADLRAAGVLIDTVTTSITVLDPAPTTTTTSSSLPGMTTTSTTLPCQTARCTLEAALHGADCTGQVIPTPIMRKLDRAVALIELAASSPPKKTRRLLSGATGVLKQVGKAATRAAKGNKPKLTAACATTIQRTAKGMRSALGS